MPVIMPIRDLRKTSEISALAHKKDEPIFITKNGYSDLVIMSTEVYDRLTLDNRIDKAIFEAEKEMAEGGKVYDAKEAFEELEKKYFG